VLIDRHTKKIHMHMLVRITTECKITHKNTKPYRQIQQNTFLIPEEYALFFLKRKRLVTGLGRCFVFFALTLCIAKIVFKMFLVIYNEIH